jgi:hypothetical protein
VRGCIAFDGSDHVFISVGIEGAANYLGIQDLAMPHGKIHRVYDDGRSGSTGAPASCGAPRWDPAAATR